MNPGDGEEDRFTVTSHSPGGGPWASSIGISREQPSNVNPIPFRTSRIGIFILSREEVGAGLDALPPNTRLVFEQRAEGQDVRRQRAETATRWVTDLLNH